MTEKEFTPKIEYYQMTDRTYRHYLTYLHLSEEFLKNKLILDVGGGLAEFAEEVNHRLENTRVVSLDVNYDLLPAGNAEEFRHALIKRGVDLIDEANDSLSLDEQLAWLEERRQSILRKSKERSDFTAADMKSLPYQDESFHLVLYNNSLYPYFNKNERMNAAVEKILSEGLRVLKDGGQLRIKPTPFRKLEEDEVIPVAEGVDQYVKLYQQERYGHGEDSNPDLLERFKNFENLPAHFFLIQYCETVDGNPNLRWRNASLVITKGDHAFGDTDLEIHDPDESAIRVLRLNIHVSTVEGLTPGKVVYLKQSRKVK